jgi:hypothetical protein
VMEPAVWVTAWNMENCCTSARLLENVAAS